MKERTRGMARERGNEMEGEREGERENTARDSSKYTHAHMCALFLCGYHCGGQVYPNGNIGLEGLAGGLAGACQVCFWGRVCVCLHALFIGVCMYLLHVESMRGPKSDRQTVAGACVRVACGKGGVARKDAYGRKAKHLVTLGCMQLTDCHHDSHGDHENSHANVCPSTWRTGPLSGLTLSPSPDPPCRERT